MPVPVIIAPTEGEKIEASSVTVKWKQQQSSGFQVEFSQSSSFPNRNTKRYRTDLYTYEYTYEDIAEGTWYVRVAAMKEGGFTDYSDVVSFVVEIPSAVGDIHTSSQPIKVIEDGCMVIYRNGNRYSATGSTTQ